MELNEMEYKYKQTILDFHDERSVFINKICALILKSNDYDIEASLKAWDDMDDFIHEHVRNAYELVDTEIPLMALYELRESGPDNFGFTDDEYNEAITITTDAVHRFFIKGGLYKV